MQTTDFPNNLRSLVFIVLSALILPASQARPVECMDARLAASYAGMEKEDQALRGRYIKILEMENAKAKVDLAEKDKIENAILATDEKNQLALDRLIKTCGWPGKLDRKRAAFSAFLIVQHAPLPYQLKYLPTIEAANARGDISNDHLTWLIDRILVRQGKPQRYGSEFEYGSNKLYPVEDSRHLNARRRKLGLPPLKEFPL